ncbi:hypothetical protein ABPG73_021236 [Tetrahymena malaccensis]
MILNYLDDNKYECLKLEQDDNVNIQAKIGDDILQIECLQLNYQQKYEKLQQIFKNNNYKFIVPIKYLLSKNMDCGYFLSITDSFEGTLKDLITKKLSQKNIVQIIIQLLLGMNELNTMHIFHSDIKPFNILFNNESDCYHVKIGHFQLSLFYNENGYLDEWTGGTRKYIAPEILKEELFLDNKSDIYSLGIVFIELIFGRFLSLNECAFLRKGNFNISQLSPNLEIRDFNEIDKFLIEEVIKKMICQQQPQRLSSDELLKIIFEFFQSNQLLSQLQI